MVLAEENLGTLFAVPPEVVTVYDVRGETVRVSEAVEFCVATDTLFELPSPARRNAEAGNPPSVSASTAFNAYGTLANCTRGCSSSPGNRALTPSQRVWPVANNSDGIPPLVFSPRKTV